MRTALKATKTFSLERAALDREIAGFFDAAPSDREERRAFESAGVATWARA
jgi:hypothetical protein